MKNRSEIIKMQNCLREQLIDSSNDPLVQRLAYVVETALEWVVRGTGQDQIDLIKDCDFFARVIREYKEYKE